MVGGDKVRSCKIHKQNSGNMTAAAESNDDVIE